MKNGKTGVILLNMGGPNSKDDVLPYLMNIFRDPGIIDLPLGFLVRPWLSKIIAQKRAPVSIKRYNSIGGKTPLNEITAAQAQLIEKLLEERGVSASVTTGMRYWNPFSEEAIEQLDAEGVEKVVALSMYPQYCKATSHSSLKEVKKLWKRRYSDLDLLEVKSWHDLPEYIEFLSSRIVEAFQQPSQFSSSESAVIFAAHSIPLKLADSGDPYKKMIEETYQMVVSKLPDHYNCHLGWQSAFGPAKWLKPVTDTIVEKLASEGVRRLIVAPLGFAAENIETLWDMDIDLKRISEEAGIVEFKRISCPNVDEGVMSGLTRLIVDATGGI